LFRSSGIDGRRAAGEEGEGEGREDEQQVYGA
jgi:hypothetical protein